MKQVICIDATPSHSLQGTLFRYESYYIVAQSDDFVVVETLQGERVMGEWHVSRFVDKQD